MQPERAEHVAEIVERALDSEADERASLIGDLCSGDADLRIEVDSLLRFEEKARVFLEMPAFELVAKIIADENSKLNPGQQLDDYTIVSLLGEGGTGETYLAEDTTLGRRVAIKLLRSGRGAASIIRRFRQDEQFPAGLTHPNIAWLYRGAITATGIPYIVMEYVEGPRLDDYCRDKALSIQERLALFRKICAAIAHAHQHLVLHRNIKPANIRVAADGEPKLLDFGIATPLDGGKSNIAEQTLAAIMVSEYACPEQLRREKMTTASDVYSLGVVLYELLTEQRPYRLIDHRPNEVARAIVEQEPAKPSTAINLAKRETRIENRESSGSRFTTNESRLLRGDLDHIILKALQKEPARRYPSVAQFYEDIDRHLVGLPVIAGKDMLGYRTGKFVKRHRVGVTAAALLSLSLIGGIIATAGQTHRANLQPELVEQRFDNLRGLADSLMSEINDSVKNLSSLQNELATAYERIGDIQVKLSAPSASDKQGDSLSSQQATGIPERSKDDQATTDLRPGGEAVSDAVQSGGKALDVGPQSAGQAPKSAQAQFDLAVAHDNLAEAMTATGESSAALDHAQQALSILRQLSAVDPTNILYRRNTALSYEKIGDAYTLVASNKKQSRARRVKTWNKARESYKQALDVFAALRDEGKLTPDNSGFTDRLAVKITDCATAVKDGKH